jgi:hypothetical protein
MGGIIARRLGRKRARYYRIPLLESPTPLSNIVAGLLLPRRDRTSRGRFGVSLPRDSLRRPSFQGLHNLFRSPRKEKGNETPLNVRLPMTIEGTLFDTSGSSN